MHLDLQSVSIWWWNSCWNSPATLMVLPPWSRTIWSFLAHAVTQLFIFWLGSLCVSVWDSCLSRDCMFCIKVLR
jgi:hypothetical protein